MPMDLHPEEPPAGPWRARSIGAVMAPFLGRVGSGDRRPAVVAIDGRSSSGKTTFAARVAALLPGTAVVHTDDLAWFHSMFGWSDLALRVLEPVHRGEPVDFRPPAWERRGRPGSIVVEAGASLLLVEGVGASRDELGHLLDACIWVQSDRRVAAARNADRVAAGEVTPSVLRQWMTEEAAFVSARRPWTGAEIVVAGTPGVGNHPTEVVVADGPLGP